MVLRTLTTNHQTGIVRRRRHHTKHLTRRGFDSYDTANLAFKQTFSQFLQFEIDAKGQVLSRLCSLVQFSITVASLYTSMSIAQQDLNTLHTTQLLLIGTLDAQLADIVAWLVIIVLFDIRW